jgi:hypothetical protein
MSALGPQVAGLALSASLICCACSAIRAPQTRLISGRSVVKAISNRSIAFPGRLFVSHSGSGAMRLKNASSLRSFLVPGAPLRLGGTS